MLVKQKTILCGANYSNCISLYTLASLSVLLTRTLEQGPGQGQGLRWQGPGPGPGLGCQGPGQGQGLESEGQAPRQ